MSETTEIVKLAVPEAARRVFAEQHGLTPPGEMGRLVDWAKVDAAVRELAGPVVVAELRRLAANGTRDLDALLYDRADELEAQS